MAVKATLEVVENAGHFLPFEQPDIVAELVVDWLQKTISSE